jgi:hypothetical protein
MQDLWWLKLLNGHDTVIRHNQSALEGRPFYRPPYPVQTGKVHKYVLI